MGHPFDDCRCKVERAKQQIGDLEKVALAFKETDPYRVTSEFDPKKTEHVFKVHIVAPIPTLYNILVGECLQSMRSALDYAICALAPNVDERTGFPIHRLASETDYKALRARKVKIANSGLIDYIDGLKPYKGGNEPLWRLSELNNRDKHRLLLTAGLGLRHVIADAGTAIPPVFVIDLYARMRRQQGLPFRIQDIPSYPPIRLTDTAQKFRIFPLENGTEIYRHRDQSRGVAFPKSDKQFEFAFDIAFNEPGILQGEPVPVVLHQTLGLVTEITDALSRLV